MKKLTILIIVLLGLTSCEKELKKKIDVSNIDISVLIERFDQKFYKADEKTLPALKKEYPYLFPINNDSIWLEKINDTLEQELYQKSQDVLKNLDSEKTQIEDLFKHVKHYHANFKEPKIITLITKLDYQNKVIYADSLLFVSLDMYLGRNNEVYENFPLYLARNFDKEHLVVDIAEKISEKYFISSKKRQFLDLIIDEGKKMYLIDMYLPSVSDALKMGYSEEKLEWVLLNESQLWKYFVTNKLLYSTDDQFYSRFIANAPFSKFYIDIDKDSPGRIGVWLGWQIVRSYMGNNNVTLHQLLQTNAEEIFKKSKYKPRK
jgi:gliding motility-associated lipoprotein GldB